VPDAVPIWFTVCSGATGACLVDALGATGFAGELDTVFGRAQTASGAAMLLGSVLGGVVAQATNLGVPYILRAVILGVTLVVAFRFMHDVGFTPRRGADPVTEVRTVLRSSIDAGWRNPPVRSLMLGGLFTGGVSFFAFYASQPYLLQLYGDPNAYSVAGLAAAIFAGAQILGGMLVPYVRRVYRRRTDGVLVSVVGTVGIMLVIGVTTSFLFALVLLAAWAMLFAVTSPLRQAFINGIIPSDQRATVLSFDSFMSSVGGAVSQPALGRVSDVYGYGPAYVVTAAIQACAIPFVILARRERAPSDPIKA
jgi:predicted MFS family arabinose efflux permease